MREVFPIGIINGYIEDYLCCLMLHEPHTQQNIPVVIGQHEADMLTLVLENTTTQRPMTHDLILSLFSKFALTLTEISIDRFNEGIFYATLHVTDGFTTKHIDCRASDAIVLAVKEEVSIMVDDKVLQETGFHVENNFDLEPAEEAPTIEELEIKLQEAESKEDYELAAELLKQINKLKGLE